MAIELADIPGLAAAHALAGAVAVGRLDGGEPAVVDTLSAGAGPPLLLVHGGAGALETWGEQLALARRWALTIPSLPRRTREGPLRRRDFELDAGDLEVVVRERCARASAHVVGFSYGAAGALALALARPQAVRSLTLIEAPLFAAAEGDPVVERLRRALERPFEAGCEREDMRAAFAAFADPARSREGAELRFADVMRFLRGARPPGQLRPELSAVRAQPYAKLVLSGSHNDALERVSDALAAGLGAARATLEGCGHFVQRHRDFNGRLESFLVDAELALAFRARPATGVAPRDRLRPAQPRERGPAGGRSPTAGPPRAAPR
jgi:pimeloyl-ACP methyl ester carboxylesterase